MITMPQTEQVLAAIRDAEHLSAKLSKWYAGFGAADAERLFDPGRSPSAYARLTDVMHRLRTAQGLSYVEHDALPGARRFDPHDPGQQAVLLHYVGQPSTVHVIRDPQKFSERWALFYTRVPVGSCDVREAAACVRDDGLTAYVTVTRAPYILALEICGACIGHLTDVALGAEILAEADARVKAAATAEATVARWRAIRAEQEQEQ